jgi:hypothetical protein
MPQTIIKREGSEAKGLFDPENFKEGKKYGSDKGIGSP